MKKHNGASHIARRRTREKHQRRAQVLQYDRILSPATPATDIERIQQQRLRVTLATPGLAYAREPLTSRDIFTQRVNGGLSQHIVAQRALQPLLESVKQLYATGKIWHRPPSEPPEGTPYVGRPWQWVVTAQCGAELQHASVKVSRPFLELPVCMPCQDAIQEPDARATA